MRGWPVTFVASALVVAIVVSVLAVGGATEDSVHAAIRATARTSVALFVVVFTASSVRRVTSWPMANRRYLGVAFAVSFFLHLGTIALAATLWPKGPVVAAANAPGMVIYAFVLAMAVTSSDRAVAWLGARRWRVLHKIGVYAIWVGFFSAYLPRALSDRAYVPLAAVLVLAMGVRLMPPLVRARVRG
jgi:DMSO/TMAO reductase YedYZ heme-binding membrane subunit